MSKNILSKTSILIFLSVSFVFGGTYNIVHAQIVANPTFAVEFPSLGINSMNTDEYTFTPGEAKKISVQVENVSIHPVDFKYKFKLIPVEGSFVYSAANGNTLFNETELSSSTVLKGGEQRDIVTTYKIPDFVGDSAVLQFVAFNSAGIQIGSKEIFLLATNKNILFKVASSSVEKNNSASVVIDTVTIMQDEVSFNVDNLEAGYVLKRDSDLIVDVSLLGKVAKDVLISAQILNTYSTTTFDAVFAGIVIDGKTSKATLTIPHKNLLPGIYEIELRPIDVKKNQLGPSKKIIVGVEGVSAVVQSFTMQTSVYPIKKGQPLYVSGSWFPNIQTSKKMMEDYVGDKELNSIDFNIKIKLQNEKGELVGEKELGYVGPDVHAEIISAVKAEHIRGIFEIWSNGVLVTSYEKDVLTAPLNSDTQENKFPLYIGLGLTVLALIVFMYVVVRRFKKYGTNNSTIIKTFIVILASTQILPMFAYAQWTTAPTSMVATTTLQFRYPSGTDISTTTWATSTYYVGAAKVVPYSRGTSTNPCVRRSLTGTTNNYVAQDLPLISGNGRMYRWENSWMKFNFTTSGVKAWYWLDQSYVAAGGWPTTQSSPAVIPTLFAKSSFIHQKELDRILGVADNMAPSWDTTSFWAYSRPLRFTTARFNSGDPGSVLGMSVYSIVSTSTYTNLMGWIDARFNIKHGDNFSSSNNYRGLLENFNNSYHYSDFNDIIPGTVNALPPEQVQDLAVFQNYTSPSSFAQRKAALGSFSSSTVIVHMDAGAFREHNRFYNDPSLPYSDNGDSIPGRYSVFNFLQTLRDETNPTIASSNLNLYDCYSSNMIVSTTTYQVVDNSYILVSLFYDEDEDGVKDANEKTLTNGSNVTNGIDGDYTIRTYYPASNGVCSLPPTISANLTLPGLYSSPSLSIGILKDSSSSTREAVAYVKSVSQVALPIFYPYYGQSGGDTYVISGLGENTVSPSDVMNLPVIWGKNSGLRNIGKSTLDSSGKLNITTDDVPVCGHTIIASSPGVAGRTYDYQNEVMSYPVPSSYVLNGNIIDYQDTSTNPIAYWKVPVTPELSTQYQVGVTDAMLPTGWSSTTPQQTITLTSTSTNQHFPVFLGVKYTGNGVCGSATTTLSMTTVPPSTNLCSSGIASAVTPGTQSSTWECLGVGGGSDASCVKQKCPTSNPYYCPATNSCVADSGACSISGVCGFADREDGQSSAGNPPYPPDNFLCDAGTASPVAGEGLPFAYHTWSCFGTNGGSTASCDRPKCSNGLVYCSTINECRTECPVTSTSTLIFDASLSPRVVRDASDQCILSWKTSSSEDLPVSCELDGVSLGGASATIQRSAPVSVGSHTLSCTNTEQDQSTTTRCLLNPSFKEI